MWFFLSLIHVRVILAFLLYYILSNNDSHLSYVDHLIFFFEFSIQPVCTCLYTYLQKEIQEGRCRLLWCANKVLLSSPLHNNGRYIYVYRRSCVFSNPYFRSQFCIIVVVVGVGTFLAADALLTSVPYTRIRNIQYSLFLWAPFTRQFTYRYIII